MIKSSPMNERQQSHIAYFLERVEHWKRLKRDEIVARMLAARDADHAHPLRSEEEGSEVFDYLRRLEREQDVGGGSDRSGRSVRRVIQPGPRSGTHAGPSFRRVAADSRARCSSVSKPCRRRWESVPRTFDRRRSSKQSATASVPSMTEE